MTLINQGSANPMNRQGEAAQFFVSAESAFRALPLIKKTMEELGVPGLSDGDASSIQQQLLFEKQGYQSQLWRGFQFVRTHAGQRLVLRGLAQQRVARLGQRGATLAAERGRDGTGLTREEGAIGFASLRGGTVAGDHDVMFLGPEERLILSHKAESRLIFARGALTAARFLSGKTPGLYTMRDVIDSL